MLRSTRSLFPASRLALAGRAPQLGASQRLAYATFNCHSRLPQPKRAHPTELPRAAFWRSHSTEPPLKTRDKEFEKEAGKKVLESNPEAVSSVSSVRRVFEESQAPPRSSDEDVLKGLKGDLQTFKETFALSSVPREAYVLGLAGTIPYLATSIATVFLSWNLITTWPTSSNFINSILIPHETAAHWLHLIEPIQVGYGAVIVSFLGAIHWGLEFAEKSPQRQRTLFRYGLGVIAPAIAWPTIFMPLEWALTAQFMGFTMLYLADSHATTRGWAPPWYGTYRWVLTAVVGAAIFISLVGRAKIGESRPRLTTSELQDLMHQKPHANHPRRNWAKEEAEEKARLKKEKEEEEKEEEEKEKEEKEKEEKEKEEQMKKDEHEKNDKSTDSGSKEDKNGKINELDGEGERGEEGREKNNETKKAKQE